MLRGLGDKRGERQNLERSSFRRAAACTGNSLCGVEPLERRLLMAAGDLDSTFGGGDGRLTVPSIPNTSVNLSSAQILPNGKFLVCGSAYQETSNSTGGFEFSERYFLARYSLGGTLDSTFGGGKGYVLTGFSRGGSQLNAEALDMAVASDGKIVLVGNTVNDDLLLARYNADGSADTTFGSAGNGKLDPGAYIGHPSITILQNGRILVAGDAADIDVAIARFTPAGDWDTTFGGDGITFFPMTLDPEAIFHAGGGMRVQPDGKILVAGDLEEDGRNQFAVARLRADGTADTSFGGGDGRIINTFQAAANWYADGLALLPGGKFTVAGSAEDSEGGFSVAVAQYGADGSVDRTFGGGDGWLVNDLLPGQHNSFGREIAVQSNGKLVVAVDISPYQGSQTLTGVLRLNANGSTDSRFGDGTGKTVVDVTLGVDGPEDVAFLPDGRILIAGGRGISRFLGDPPGPGISSVVTTGEVFSDLVLRGRFSSGGSGTIVRVTNATGISVDLEPSEVSNTEVRLIVPPYLDRSTGALTSGTLNVQVIQGGSSTPSVPVKVQALPTLPSAAKPGGLMLATLQAQRDVAVETRTFLQGKRLYTSGVAKDFDAHIKYLDRRIVQLSTAKGGSVDFGTTPAGRRVILTSEDLKEMDRVELASLKADAQGTGGAAASAQAVLNAIARNDANAVRATSREHLKGYWLQSVNDGDRYFKKKAKQINFLGKFAKASENAAVKSAPAVFKRVEIGTQIAAGVATAAAAGSLEDPVERERALDRSKAFFESAAMTAAKEALKIGGKTLGTVASALDPTAIAVDTTQFPYLSISAVQPETIESEGNEGRFVLEFNIAPDGAYRVPWTLLANSPSGLPRATNGTDYRAIDASGVATVRGVRFISVPIIPKPDLDDSEGTESATIRLLTSNESDFMVLGDPAAEVKIADRPKVTVTAAPAELSAAGNATGTFTFKRSGPAWGMVKVEYASTGTAIVGTHYIDTTTTAGSRTIVLNPGELTKTVTIKGLLAGAGKTVTIGPKDKPSAYARGTPKTASIRLVRQTRVTVSVVDNVVSEAGKNPGVFRISRDKASSTPLNVRINLSGAAIINTDYAAKWGAAGTAIKSNFGTVTIPANATSVDVTITPVDDAIPEPGGEVVRIALTASEQYSVDGTGTQFTIADNDDNKGIIGTYTGAATLRRDLGGQPDRLRWGYEFQGTMTLNITENVGDNAGTVTLPKLRAIPGPDAFSGELREPLNLRYGRLLAFDVRTDKSFYFSIEILYELRDSEGKLNTFTDILNVTNAKVSGSTATGTFQLFIGGFNDSGSFSLSKV